MSLKTSELSDVRRSDQWAILARGGERGVDRQLAPVHPSFLSFFPSSFLSVFPPLLLVLEDDARHLTAKSIALTAHCR